MPDRVLKYKQLYEMAQLEVQNLRNQLTQMEMKAAMLNRLIERQEAFATEMKEKATMMKAVAENMKRIGFS